MPNRIENLRDFLEAVSKLLELVSVCRELLFRKEFRDNIHEAIAEVNKRLEGFLNHERILYPQSFREEIEPAGLVDGQLKFKLESFGSALADFESEGGQDNLEQVLDKGGILLGSLANAIPGFGSFAQELVDFLLKELRKRKT